MFDVTRGGLAAHTTLRLGGPAGRVDVATAPDELVQMVRDAPALVLAGGSNVVIADDGVPGRVVLVRSTGIAVEADGDDAARLTVEAGHVWDDVVALRGRRGSGRRRVPRRHPGSAGATPIQNVGAYGQEVAESIVAVRTLRPRHRRGARPAAGRVRLRLPDQRVQAQRPPCRARGDVPAAALAGLGAGALRRAGPHPRCRPRASARRWPPCGRPCWPCAPARGWCSTRPTRTPTRSGRSS